MVDISLQEVRSAADVVRHVKLVGRALCHEAAAMRAGVVDDAL